MAKKPTLLFIPGAWHPWKIFQPFISRLEAIGFEVHPVDYPSTSPNPIDAGMGPDVEVVRRKLEFLSDRGDDIMMIVHSAAGVIGSQAAEGFSKSDRQGNGKAGGIVKMFYAAAFAAPEGVSLIMAIKDLEPWMTVEKGGRVLSVAKETAKKTFYNCCEPDVAETAAEQLQLLSRSLFETQPTYAAWKHIPSAYLLCEKDQAILAQAQEGMISQPGADFQVFRCDTDHSPFLSAPEFTLSAVVEAAGQ